MRATRTWRRLLRERGEGCLDWLAAGEVRIRMLKRMANDLARFLISSLYDAEACQAFWSAIPSVRSACNDNQTYSQPYAAESYAYVHLLDRYWRTWDVLIELDRAAALPLGGEGVRVLDVDTGPAPTPLRLLTSMHSCERMA